MEKENLKSNSTKETQERKNKDSEQDKSRQKISKARQIKEIRKN